MIMRPGAGRTAAGLQPDAAAELRLRRARPPASGNPASIKVLNGAASGREVTLTKVVTTVGKPGVQVASITQRPSGYVFAHVEGSARPVVNGMPLAGESVPLRNGDVIELAGTQMQFIHPRRPRRAAAAWRSSRPASMRMRRGRSWLPRHARLARAAAGHHRPTALAARSPTAAGQPMDPRRSVRAEATAVAGKPLDFMQIRVLGCSGSIAAGNRTTSFLLDDDMLIDAGTGVGDLTLDELTRIDHIFLSHSHLDHVLAIGLLADSVARRRGALRPAADRRACAARRRSRRCARTSSTA